VISTENPNFEIASRYIEPTQDGIANTVFDVKRFSDGQPVTGLSPQWLRDAARFLY
jgi:hypothetical protein